MISIESKMDSPIKKFVRLKINGVNIKWQLITSNDISFSNTDTRKKIGKHLLREKNSENCTWYDGWQTILCKRNLEWRHSSRKTCKAKVYVVNNAKNLFDTNLLELSGLWDISISRYCKKLNSCPTSEKNSTAELKKTLIKNVTCNFVHELSVTTHDIKMKSTEDNYITYKNERNVEHFTLGDDALKYPQRVAVPAALQKRILQDSTVDSRECWE